MTIGGRLDQFIKLAFGKRATAAAALGVTAPTLYPYLKNEKEPGASVLKRLAAFGCNTHWLLTGEGEIFADNEAGDDLRRRAMADETLRAVTLAEGGVRYRAGKSYRLPLYFAPARKNGHSPVDGRSDANEDLNHYLITNPESSFVVRVVGYGMDDAGIECGDLLVADRNLMPNDGDVVVTAIRDETTVRRLETLGKRRYLYPLNSEEDRIEIKRRGSIRILGVVTGLARRVKR